jgi:hypothetical protein
MRFIARPTLKASVDTKARNKDHKALSAAIRLKDIKFNG